MNPVIGISATGNRVHSNLFGTLARRNSWAVPEGETLDPWLAQSRERATLNIRTIRIREGVSLHDGHETDAEDFAFSMSAGCLRGPEPIARCATRHVRGITVEATGSMTIEIETALSACLVGDWLRDILDPTLNSES